MFSDKDIDRVESILKRWVTGEIDTSQADRELELAGIPPIPVYVKAQVSAFMAQDVDISQLKFGIVIDPNVSNAFYRVCKALSISHSSLVMALAAILDIWNNATGALKSDCQAHTMNRLIALTAGYVIGLGKYDLLKADNDAGLDVLGDLCTLIIDLAKTVAAQYPGDLQNLQRFNVLDHKVWSEVLKREHEKG